MKVPFILLNLVFPDRAATEFQKSLRLPKGLSSELFQVMETYFWTVIFVFAMQRPHLETQNMLQMIKHS